MPTPLPARPRNYPIEGNPALRYDHQIYRKGVASRFIPSQWNAEIGKEIRLIRQVRNFFKITGLPIFEMIDEHYPQIPFPTGRGGKGGGVIFHAELFRIKRFGFQSRSGMNPLGFCVASSGKGR